MKLNVGTVINTRLKDKGWETIPSVGENIWVAKNNGGSYTSPYVVNVVASVEIDAQSKGCLIYSITSLEDFFGHICSTFDVIGRTEKEVITYTRRISEKSKMEAKALKATIERVKNTLHTSYK